jgi:hypothetical protein
MALSGEFLTDFGRLLFLNDNTNYWFLYYQYLLLLAIFSQAGRSAGDLH